MDTSVQRKNMVDSQVRPSDVTDRRIFRAMMAVPREAFVPPSRRDIAYMDGAISLATGSRGSARELLAPRTLAKLIQSLTLGDDALVLDVGVATGYSSAVLAHIARHVVALESDERLAGAARAALASLAIGNVDVVGGPLVDGVAARCPFDAVLIGGRIAEVPAALLDQVKDGGRLIAIVDQDGVGKATEWRRFGMGFDRRPLFDAEAAVLPGFEHKAEFVF